MVSNRDGCRPTALTKSATFCRVTNVAFRTLNAAVLMSCLGCGPAVQDSDATGSAGGTADASTTGDEASTSAAPPPPTTDSTTAPVPPQPPEPLPETTSGAESSSDGDPTVDPCACNFLCPPCPAKGCPGYDPECGTNFECDIWEQDCPDGEKCTPWANDGGLAWNATRCAPIAPDADQVGEPCAVEGNSGSGVDSCDISQLCFDTDADDNGTCVGFCGGTENEPVCPKGQACSVSNLGTVALCLPTCDPLMPTCVQGEGCFPTDGATAFVCLAAPTPNIDSPWTCLSTGGCEPGTICLASFNLPECEEEECCTPYCDLSNPTCPVNTECLPFWEKGAAPPELETLGVCAVP